MDFFLDCLFISLVILCIILVYRLVRSRLLHKHRSRDLHPTLLPFEPAPNSPDHFRIRYELPTATKVSISLLNKEEEPLIKLIDKDHELGNFYFDTNLSESRLAAFVLFETKDTKILRKI